MSKSKDYTINPMLGIILKKLRKSKGCTLKEAAGSSFSSAHLSNFEHGKTELSSHLFLELLKNINVSIIEFQRYYENSLTSYNSNQVSNEDISSAHLTGNITKLNNVLSILESNSELDGSKHCKLEIIRIRAIISSINPSRVLPKEDIYQLKSYLLQLEEWGRYDISLLGQCCTNFDLGSLAILTDHMLNPCQSTITLESNQHILVQTVLNIMAFFIENKQYERANRLINYLKNIKVGEHYMLEKLIFIYNSAKLDYKLGDKSALKVLEKCENILEFCGCFDNANVLSKEITTFKNEK
ncbi:Rgg/GadR/MutR family transcriptional regulator [Lactococcus lactis subsp. lactis]|uniref:Rgg/GadR/MutR family transcriptional regulator n=1 Tax=Lactococcus lactis TaxID=1358 RepID=UPI00223B411C|nr:Rgg/GadR/MutR family transcriptional regulator [Lactococcus lactis]MCT0016547.1 Rgg/GadR/MutR family transcriptional regulator [Lactococcus lactis subsp. lactis]